MKKLTAAVTTLCVILTACAKTETPAPETSGSSGSEASVTASEFVESQTVTSVTSETFGTSERESGGLFLDYLGIKIDISEVETNENGYFSVYLDDYAYARKTTGVSYNSADDPDFYDAETFELKIDYCELNPVEKIKVGDKFGDLTVSKTRFGYQGTISDGELIYQECDSAVDYAGSVTLKGYASVTTVTEGYETKGDISFLPDSDSFKDIPYPINAYTRLGLRYYNDGGLVIYSDSPVMSLGSLYDKRYANADLSAISDDGTARYVEVTLTDLQFDSNDQIGSRYSAVITGCAPS